MYWLFSIISVWVFHFFISPWVDPYFFTILMFTGINIILAASLNLVNGFTGQFSLGHAGFMSMGAYASAMITVTARNFFPEMMATPVFSTLLFLLSLGVGGTLAALAGYGVGLPSLRLKGDYLAVVTLGFGEIIRVVFLNIDFVGGARGLPDIPYLSTFGWIYTVVILTLFIIWRTLHSSQGRAFLAVREDEIAAEAMGVHVTSAKVRTFVMGAFFAGIAGGLFAHYLRYLNPAIFDFNRSFEVVIMVVLGGMGSLTGSVVAAILLTFSREGLRFLQEFTQIDLRMVIYSLLLILMMIVRPKGLFGSQEWTTFFRKKR